MRWPLTQRLSSEGREAIIGRKGTFYFSLNNGMRALTRDSSARHNRRLARSEK